MTESPILIRTVGEEEEQAGWKDTEGGEERQRLRAGGRHHNGILQVLQYGLQAKVRTSSSQNCQAERKTYSGVRRNAR